MRAETNRFHEAVTFEEARASLGEMLGLGNPAPPEVTRRALVDRKFAMYLMLTRDSPALRDQLLNASENQAYITEAGATRTTGDAAELAPKGAVDLSAKAITSMLKWAQTGFKTADESMVTRRWNACQTCEYLADPPGGLIYRGLRLLAGAESKVCSACGCLARKKVTLPTEACPKEDPGNPGFTRWGEPLRRSHSGAARRLPAETRES